MDMGPWATGFPIRGVHPVVDPADSTTLTRQIVPHIRNGDTSPWLSTVVEQVVNRMPVVGRDLPRSQGLRERLRIG
jgi:hypothetical protein